jgi:hypothetical protein
LSEQDIDNIVAQTNLPTTVEKQNFKYKLLDYMKQNQTSGGYNQSTGDYNLPPIFGQLFKNQPSQQQQQQQQQQRNYNEGQIIENSSGRFIMQNGKWMRMVPRVKSNQT